MNNNKENNQSKLTFYLNDNIKHYLHYTHNE